MVDRVKIVWDMETGDPDDFFTLLLLLGHPRVDLRAVTVTPGTPHQIGVVRWAMSRMGRDLPVGSFNIDHGKQCVSAWHYRVFGDIPPSEDAQPGWSVIAEHCDEDTTLVTGAPLKNLGALLARPDMTGWRLGRWVGQGGFAGEGVVPPELQLDKFKGHTVVPTYNFNGAPAAAEAALADDRIRERWLVSKNVCHRVYYDAAFHEQVGMVRHRSPAMSLIWQGMEAYLRRKRQGKKFHDPLAACCAINTDIGTWARVALFRRGGRWGARRCEDSSTRIIVDYDHDAFVRTFTEHATVHNEPGKSTRAGDAQV
jgi:pyrimidine-specific ribonucleoside hydrolase